MPVKPDIQKMTKTSPEILNVIRNNATPYYQSAVPMAEGNTKSIREIGNIIMQYQPLQNEFLSALVNRIGRVIITSKLYENPWAFAKKGMLEFGETVEEIFVNIARPHQFDPQVAETEVFKREIPDVRAAFHTMNYQKFYKATISNDQLRQAFLSWEGITDLIARIVDAMYTGANYDEFLTMKYLIFKMALNGNIFSSTIPAVTADSAKGIVTTIKGISNQLEFMSSQYNMAGVPNFTLKRDQFILLTAAFDATIDVEVLASAFNIDKAEFMGRRVLVDSFSALDTARLDELFADDPTYVTPTAEQLALMDSVQAVILDRDWFMVFDNFYNFTEQYNGQGLYWNYWYHVWKTFSASPFANAIMFTTTASEITSVTVSPSTATIAKGASAQFTATVEGTGLIDKSVKWEKQAPDADFTITQDGLVTIGTGTLPNSVQIRARSVADPTKVGTAIITIPNT